MNDYEMKQVQYIGDTDTRSFIERHNSLPFVRDEELPEWEEWWNRVFFGIVKENVSNNR